MNFLKIFALLAAIFGMYVGCVLASDRPFFNPLKPACPTKIKCPSGCFLKRDKNLCATCDCTSDKGNPCRSQPCNFPCWEGPGEGNGCKMQCLCPKNHDDACRLLACPWNTRCETSCDGRMCRPQCEANRIRSVPERVNTYENQLDLLLTLSGTAKGQNYQICSLNRDTGPCRSYTQQYYFNRRTSQCEVFTYGGCKGNKNRFLTKNQCETACIKVLSCPYKCPQDCGQKVLPSGCLQCICDGPVLDKNAQPQSSKSRTDAFKSSKYRNAKTNSESGICAHKCPQDCGCLINDYGDVKCPCSGNPFNEPFPPPQPPKHILDERCRKKNCPPSCKCNMGSDLQAQCDCTAHPFRVPQAHPFAPPDFPTFPPFKKALWGKEF